MRLPAQGKCSVISVVVPHAPYALDPEEGVERVRGDLEMIVGVYSAEVERVVDPQEEAKTPFTCSPLQAYR